MDYNYRPIWNFGLKISKDKKYGGKNKSVKHAGFGKHGSNSKKQDPFWEANSSPAGPDISRINSWNQRTITAYSKARLFSMFWARRIQSTSSHPVLFLTSVLVLSSHPAYLFQVVSMLPVAKPKPSTHFPSLSLTLATCHTNLILIDFITPIIFRGV
jgi:hypothetical protein